MPASPEAKRLKVQEEPVMKDVTEVDEALLEISQLNRDIQVLEGELEADIAPLRAAKAKLIDPKVARCGRLQKDVKEFCEYNREKLFTEGKSLNLVNGSVGFRFNPASLKMIKGKWSVEKAVAKIKELFPRLSMQLITVKTTVAIDKDRVKQTIAPTDLKKIGHMLERDEFFWFQPKGEKIASEVKSRTVEVFDIEPAEQSSRKVA